MRLTPVTLSLVLAGVPLFADPLPSWSDTEAKEEIIEFVEMVTDPDSEDYVTASDRIAVFDNDGTLWAEQPYYFQLIYALDRLKEMAEDDPDILSSDILKAAAEDDMATVAAGGHEALFEVIALTHAGLSVEEFQDDVRDWLDEADHPTTGMAYDAMLYQPMLELLRYLRDEGFETWIVS
ncbi:MAG: HAD family hydrolase, partial [Pseudomonadota bacterium]